ncbi:MAG: hypothetical protein U5K28_06590 [Halobacteriales archaeon]|nr:hypothetical protein [Halobacteriales archaeon]
MASDAPTVGDHLAIEHADIQSGVYRVVGVGDQRVTLLLVGDEGARRIHTGQVVSAVDQTALDAFESADPPTRQRSLAESARAGLSVGYWSMRANARQLRARPIQTAAITLLLAGGLLLDVFNLVPEAVASALVIGASILFVLVVVGRLD